MLVIIFIPCSTILLNAATILKAIGQPVASSDKAQEYLNVFLPGLFFFALNDGLRRYFNSFGYSTIPFYI